MLARLWSCALAGLRGEPVRVEVDIHPGLPNTTIVGMPDPVVRESKDRLYAALRNSGFTYPRARVTVNLAPADVPKAGPWYDLPIALGILRASDQLVADIEDLMAIGEIALDGCLRFTRGILPVAAAARARGFASVLVPRPNAAEAALVPGIEVIAPADLPSLVMHLVGARRIEPQPAPSLAPTPIRYSEDLGQVRGQEHARRALELAAAGGHNMLLTGPPGAGKTMLARCLPSILPPLSVEEALVVTSVYSVAGALPSGVPLLRHRPFRSPHHTVSYAGLVGGGNWPRPGEVSLAHHGVLFLDELPEFDARVLEVIRQPLEDRVVTIARAAGAATYPASFMLIAARNPCPCGYLGDPDHECVCSAAAIHRYARRISGPLADRIDIHLDVPRVDFGSLGGDRTPEPSSCVRRRVQACRDVQRERFAADGARSETHVAHPFPSEPHVAASPRSSNAEMRPEDIRRFCRLSPEGAELMLGAARRLGLTARGYHRVLKLARTIADLEGTAGIAPSHLAEALQYRPREPD